MQTSMMNMRTMNKKVPLRTCIITREKLPKKDLIRIVKNKDGEVQLDLEFKLNGRGAYIKKDKKVIAKAIEKNQIQRALKIKQIPESILVEIKKQIT